MIRPFVGTCVLLILLGCSGDGPTPPPKVDPPPQPQPPSLPGSWATRAAPADTRSETQAAVLGGKVYLVGGLAAMAGPNSALSSVEVYDPATNGWSSAPPLPEGRHHFGMAAANGKLYVIGGYGPGPFPWTPANTVFELDPATGRWTAKRPMERGRAAHAAVAVGGKVYVLGGEHGGIRASTTAEVYDPATDTWSPLPPLPTAREHLAAAAIGSRIYVVGGRITGDYQRYWETTTNQSALEVYSPETNAWAKLAPMPTARGGLAAAVVDGKLYAFGGEHPGTFSETEEYDPQKNSWRQMAHLPTPRHGLAAAALGRTIHVIGGGTAQGGSWSTVHEAFTPP